jgi:hypothetical protein
VKTRPLSWFGPALALLWAGLAAAPAEFKLVGDWEVWVTVDGAPAVGTRVQVTPVKLVTVAAERYRSLPLFNPSAGGWIKGAQLHGVQAQETTTPGLLDAESFVLRAGPEPGAVVFQRGKDYEVDLLWGTFGRTSNSLIQPEQPVFAAYRHAQLRLDAVVQSRDGRIALRQGEARAAAPAPPRIDAGERHLGNIWLPGRLTRLGPEHLFPILESAYPEPRKPSPSPAERGLPMTMKKLQAGQRLRLLAWGDSVTVGTLSAGLGAEPMAGAIRRPPARAAFPGGHRVGHRGLGRTQHEQLPGRTAGQRAQLPREGARGKTGPDRVGVRERRGAESGTGGGALREVAADFQGIGAEWIILTPHYVRPDWMGLAHEREIDDDPRPYVAGLRQFAARHPVALADAARRYGRLWRQGIPYTALMLNSINHPDAQGMKIFADALMELFP